VPQDGTEQKTKGKKMNILKALPMLVNTHQHKITEDPFFKFDQFCDRLEERIEDLYRVIRELREQLKL
jgi:hypothetical protein